MESKILVSAVSLILVAGIALGVVALVRTTNQNSYGNETGSGTGDDLTTHNKAVKAVCQNTDDQKLCVDTLTPLNTSNPKDYIKTVVQTSMESVIKAFNMSDRLTIQNNKSNPSTKMALEDCKDLLQFAIDELQASSILVNDNNINNVNDRTADLKNWLGAVIAYQQSCLDGFDTEGEKKIQTELQTGSLDNVGKLTALALDVVSGISQVLSNFNLNLNVKPSSRRLLEIDHDGYPNWVSSADRKLLAANMNKGGGGSVAPNAVVAKDGSGQYKTVLDAINAYPLIYLTCQNSTPSDDVGGRVVEQGVIAGESVFVVEGIPLIFELGLGFRKGEELGVS